MIFVFLVRLALEFERAKYEYTNSIPTNPNESIGNLLFDCLAPQVQLSIHLLDFPFLLRRRIDELLNIVLHLRLLHPFEERIKLLM